MPSALHVILTSSPTLVLSGWMPRDPLMSGISMEQIIGGCYYIHTIVALSSTVKQTSQLSRFEKFSAKLEEEEVKFNTALNHGDHEHKMEGNLTQWSWAGPHV